MLDVASSKSSLHNAPRSRWLRRFVFSMMLIFGAFLALLPALQGTLAQPPSENAETAARQDSVYLLTLNDDMISPITAEYIQQGIDEAYNNQAAAVVIQLDTPGGLLSSTHSILKTILNAPIPVMVYVAPAGARAGSAGVFITMAAHVAAMHPTSHIGAAHPVDVSGNWPVSPEEEREQSSESERKDGETPKEPSKEGGRQVMSEKILNDTIATMRVLAKTRGRNEDWAVRAITESATLTAPEALEKNVIDIVAPDVYTLIQQANGRTVEMNAGRMTIQLESPSIVTFEFSKRQQFLAVLTHPVLVYLLLMLGFYGLFYEITNPGFGVPGIAGIVCLTLALIGMQNIPINMAGLGLLAVGIILFIVEIFTPAFGILFAGGVLCLLLGTLFLYQSSEPYLMSLMPYLLGTVVALTALTGFLVFKIMKVQRNKPTDPLQKLVGQVGQVVAPIEPPELGKVFVFGETWNATSQTPLAHGQRVRVTGFEQISPTVLTVIPFVQEEP
jgi:membrane-bound serine protease (ClpP class)